MSHAATKGVFIQSEEKPRVEPAEGALLREDVGDDGRLLIEIIQRGGGYDDHLLKNRPEEPDGPVDQSFPFDAEKCLVFPHSSATAARKDHTGHVGTPLRLCPR